MTSRNRGNEIREQEEEEGKEEGEEEEVLTPGVDDVQSPVTSPRSCFVLFQPCELRSGAFKLVLRVIINTVADDI